MDNNREAYLQIVEDQQSLDGRFANIRRVGPLGGGGRFSLLFSADDGTSGHRVALKVFHPDRLHEPLRFERFCREATMSLALAGQPDLVQWVAPRSSFTQQMQAGNVRVPLTFHYYGLELAETDVLALLHERSPAAYEVLRIFHIMCRAVQRIHAANITHRDLKPDNFLVMPSGAIVLSDFGTARQLVGGDGALAGDYRGIWPGDYRYIAPEMNAGLLDADAALALGSDVFALGTILFEMLTGSELLPLVLDADDLAQLNAIAQVRDVRKRREVYDGIVTALCDGRPLPSVRDLTDSVPRCVVDIVDALYRSMAALNYRERVRHFQDVFRRIEVARIVLRNEAKVRRWLENKRKRRVEADERLTGARQ